MYTKAGSWIVESTYLILDAQVPEELDHVGVVLVVEHHEPAVHAHALHVHRVRVPARLRRGLVHHHLQRHKSREGREMGDEDRGASIETDWVGAGMVESVGLQCK